MVEERFQEVGIDRLVQEFGGEKMATEDTTTGSQFCMHQYLFEKTTIMMITLIKVVVIMFIVGVS